ncbi:MAG: FtsQ-type POTRA domain-containing protein [candidate division KSB1 bacterium]|nr:FtsQ-type POTRA domain-containing protein [candidate division KSB1 bacterium]
MRKAGKIVFFSTSLLLIVMHLSLWIQDNQAFSVQNIRVTGAYLVSADEILQAARDEAQKHIFKADLRTIEKRLAKFPQVKSVRVSRVFPNSIRIELEEREPVAVIIDNGIWGVDAEGVLLPRLQTVRGLDFPVIVGLQLRSYIAGEVVKNPRIRELAKILGELRQQNPVVYHLISEITMNKLTGVQLTLITHQVPVILGRGRLMQKFNKLKSLYQYLLATHEMKSVRYLDLRFHDQIVLKRKA